MWVIDDDFDIDRHVHRMALPSPGGDRELADLCGHLAGIPLDRSRPLWEFFVIEGLESGKVAVFTKMHHSTVDGVSGANAISYLCSLEPDAPPIESAPKDQRQPRTPSDTELLARGVVTNLAKPVQMAKMVAPTANVLTRTIGRARSGTAMAAPLTAPRTSFNGTITGHRTIAIEDMSLEKIKEIKRAVDGATVNDVVITLCGGALRRYLDERNELPETSLLASVPVSVREESKKSGGSNKVSTIFSRLGTDIADPVERLKQVSAANHNAKDHHKTIPADTLQDWAEFAAPRTFGLAVRMVSSLGLADTGPVIHNLVISNVPGPAGAAVLHGRQDRGALPARADLPRRRPEHHRDVQREQDARRRDRVPRAGAAAVEADREVPRGARGAVRRAPTATKKKPAKKAATNKSSIKKSASKKSAAKKSASKKTAAKKTASQEDCEVRLGGRRLGHQPQRPVLTW